MAGTNVAMTERGAALDQGNSGTSPTAAQALPPQVGIGSFLKRGCFNTWSEVIQQLTSWASLVGAAGHESQSLAAWICVSHQITVKLATRSYWKHLTPRGPARSALDQVDAAGELRCIISYNGASRTTLLSHLARWIESDTPSGESRVVPPPSAL